MSENMCSICSLVHSYSVKSVPHTLGLQQQFPLCCWRGNNCRPVLLQGGRCVFMCKGREKERRLMYREHRTRKMFYFFFDFFTQQRNVVSVHLFFCGSLSWFSLTVLLYMIVTWALKHLVSSIITAKRLAYSGSKRIYQMSQNVKCKLSLSLIVSVTWTCCSCLFSLYIF